jgi:hypothetical protein
VERRQQQWEFDRPWRHRLSTLLRATPHRCCGDAKLGFRTEHYAAAVRVHDHRRPIIQQRASIAAVKMGTNRCTNALLERKGEGCF